MSEEEKKVLLCQCVSWEPQNTSARKCSEPIEQAALWLEAELKSSRHCGAGFYSALTKW